MVDLVLDAYDLSSADLELVDEVDLLVSMNMMDLDLELADVNIDYNLLCNLDLKLLDDDDWLSDGNDVVALVEVYLMMNLVEVDLMMNLVVESDVVEIDLVELDMYLG